MLDRRCQEQIEEKSALARLFRERFGHLMKTDGLNLFFDCGSTPAYVAREVGQFLLDRGAVRGQYGGVPQVLTNNALAFLQLWLNARIQVSLLPSSPPSEPYGACFGILEEMIDRNLAPQYDQRPLAAVDAQAVELLCMELANSFGQRRFLIIGAASGVQLSEDHELHTANDRKVTDAVRTSVQKCYGFHVGSEMHPVLTGGLYKL